MPILVIFLTFSIITFPHICYSQSNYEKALLDLKLNFLNPSQEVNLTQLDNKIISDLFNKYGTNRKFQLQFELDNLYLKNIANVTDKMILSMPGFENKTFYDLLEIRWNIFEVREDKRVSGPQHIMKIIYLTKLVSTQSEVLIKDEGWMPLIVFPTVGAGDPQNIYNNTSVDYSLEINKKPVLTQFFMFPTKNLDESKPLNIKGEVILGDSAIITEVDRVFYPFDKYSFDLEIEPQYLTKFKLEDIEVEGFTVRSSIKQGFNEITLKSHERYKLNLVFERKNIFESFIGPAIILFAPFPITLVFKLKEKKNIRYTSYVTAFVVYMVASNQIPETIQYFYPLKLIALTGFVIAIILMELNYNRNFLHQLKQIKIKT